MKIAVVGATGLVGTKMLQVLSERNFPVSELIPVASPRSWGKEVVFRDKAWRVVGPEQALERAPSVALFSAGAATSLEWAPRFAQAGTFVIDNSSAWRMDPGVKLIVPEINAHLLGPDDRLVANPNCSTIQMVVALAPLHRAFGISRLVISTYQSVTGTGVKAVRQLEQEERGIEGEKAYPSPIYRNCLPHCDVFLDNGYTKEEMKLVNETRKILGEPALAVTATAVRVPVNGGHSESINVEFERPFRLAEVRELLAQAPGVLLHDDPAALEYPTPRKTHESDLVWVGRIRVDESRPNCLNLWVVADNLRKGAATNAVQIAEHLLASGLLRQPD